MIENAHSFVIPAYHESPFLEECILSLKNQKIKSDIIITTSTPSDYLRQLSSKHSVALCTNLTPNRSISSDWNYAYNAAPTDFVTLAHQDDIYCANYTEKIFAGNNDFLIAFTNYFEIKNGNTVKLNFNLLIKKLLLLPFIFKKNIATCLIKKAVLALGSPICCPSVTYNKKKLGNFNFNSNYSITLDWLAWLRLAQLPGNFKYVKQPVVYHRIHNESETTTGLIEQRRQFEDQAVFQQIWGKRLGRILACIYSHSYKSNH